MSVNPTIWVAEYLKKDPDVRLPPPIEANEDILKLILRAIHGEVTI